MALLRAVVDVRLRHFCLLFLFFGMGYVSSTPGNHLYVGGLLGGPPPRPHHGVRWEGGGELGAYPAAHGPGDIRTTRVDPGLAATEADQVIDACERVLATVPIG